MKRPGKVTRIGCDVHRKFGIATARDRKNRKSGRVTLQGYLQMPGRVRRQIAAATRKFRKQVKRSPTV